MAFFLTFSFMIGGIECIICACLVTLHIHNIAIASISKLLELVYYVWVRVGLEFLSIKFEAFRSLDTHYVWKQINSCIKKIVSIKVLIILIDHKKWSKTSKVLEWDSNSNSTIVRAKCVWSHTSTRDTNPVALYRGVASDSHYSLIFLHYFPCTINNRNIST